MKINTFEAHDRLQHLQKDQWSIISQGAEDCLKKNPDSLTIQSKCPYIYIFAHPRTADDGVTKRMLWQPRISRPTPQTNSYCFRAISNSDTIEVCWLLPPREMWTQYDKGKVTESDIVAWSIEMFQHHRKTLSDPHPEDLSEEMIREKFIQARKDLKFKKI